MTIAEKYFKKQRKSEEFRRLLLKEKVKLDIEYRPKELKKGIQGNKSAKEWNRTPSGAPHSEGMFCCGP